MPTFPSAREENFEATKQLDHYTQNTPYMAISFSTSIDYSLQDGSLNLYIPVLPATKGLVQEFMDIKNPLKEHYEHETLIAVEWEFRGKRATQLLRSKKWQRLFK